MHCLVWEGLGNRLNALASCIATGRDVELVWAVNSHCPLLYHEVLKPIDGVTVQNVNARRFTYSRNAHRYCYYYLTNLTENSNRQFGCDVRKIYRQLLRSLTAPRPTLPNSKTMAGIHYRAHMPESPTVDQFIEQADRWLAKRNSQSVFVSSDSAEAQQRIADTIANSFTIDQQHIASDLQRSRASVTDCVRAMKAFKSCKLGVFASTFRSTVTDAVRSWVHVDYAEREQNHRNQSLERWVASNGNT